MHEKINPRSLYTTDNTIANNRQGENGDSTSNEENEKDEKEDNNIQWEEQYVAIKLINISTTTPLAHDNLIVRMFKIHPWYYVNFLTNFITMNQQIVINTTNVIVNIDEATLELEVGNNNFISITQ
jgi:hypothetical protein